MGFVLLNAGARFDNWLDSELHTGGPRMHHFWLFCLGDNFHLCTSVKTELPVSQFLKIERDYGILISGSVQGQIGWGSEQPGIVQGTHGRRTRKKLSLRSFPIQIILWFCDYFHWLQVRHLYSLFFFFFTAFPFEELISIREAVPREDWLYWIHIELIKKHWTY